MGYYEEKWKQADMKKSFCREGFMKRVREIADALSACAPEDVPSISEHLAIAVEVMNDVNDDLERAKINYEEELKKHA